MKKIKKIRGKLELGLEEHKLDATRVRDFVFWSFQKSYKQQGKSFRDTNNLEICEEL